MPASAAIFFTRPRRTKRRTNFDNDHAGIHRQLQARWKFDNRWYAWPKPTASAPASRTPPRPADRRRLPLDGVPGAKLHWQNWAYYDTLTLSTGHTIVNSFRSESRAVHPGIPAAAGKYVDWSATSSTKQHGAGAPARAAAQLWLIRSLNEKVEFGMGAGPTGLGRPRHPGPRHTPTACCQPWPATMSTATGCASGVEPVVTDYHRDADVLLVGGAEVLTSSATPHGTSVVRLGQALDHFPRQTGRADLFGFRAGGGQ